MGDVQLVRVESWPTNLHWNVEPSSVEVNPKVAVVPVTLPLGPLVMVVSGGVVSVPPLLLPLAGKVTKSKNGYRPVAVLAAFTPMVWGQPKR